MPPAAKGTEKLKAVPAQRCSSWRIRSATRAASEAISFKLAQIVFTFDLARELDPVTIAANCLHPATYMARLSGVTPISTAIVSKRHRAVVPGLLALPRAANLSLTIVSYFPLLCSPFAFICTNSSFSFAIADLSSAISTWAAARSRLTAAVLSCMSRVSLVSAC